MESAHFEIYTTADSIIVLRDPTRIRVIHFIGNGSKEFDEIVAHIGKAKSTVSSHLARLEERGFIMSQKDEEDARKKTYKCVAKLIATSSKSEPVVYVYEKEYFKELE